MLARASCARFLAVDREDFVAIDINPGLYSSLDESWGSGHSKADMV
jgi:hypothetical protein